MADAAVDDLLRYERGWTNAMGDYWRERMERLRTIDTYRLYASIKAHLEQGSVTTIEHNFLQYGIYVAAGVGPKHMSGTSGPRHREARKSTASTTATSNSWAMNTAETTISRNRRKWAQPGAVASLYGEPKGCRDWFSKKYYSSVMKLNEHEATFYGDGTMV